ncbi:SpoIIE family protein phosphatase [Streptomyces sp. NBC_01637]|uniref:ATP-binding SpoIIE family protein phosphatase n=1 Tax=unclassified Streptomyces TaxID=2593676 RepID=UPI003864A4E8|nr:SpoIIE family protein phosphatase [Streptomyces sp. NBC_01653]WTC84470.1 SpoIIE family protein phosphatase [Streptomyces sp. NBC_01653]WTD86397.1 SpoIIE family protein phosphatase [Streptomyces sp. NBC_01637]WTD94127.1 SpoIIE family protein phosphatase [Streptomyces sp. NBC_01637]
MDSGFDAAVLDALFTQPPIGLQVLDPELRIVRFNSAALGVQGLDMSDAVGRTWRELGIAADDVESMLRTVLETGEAVTDFRYRGRLAVLGGVEKVLSISAFRLQDAEGRTLGVAGTVVDITERDRAERRLQLLYRAGERIGSSLDVFRTAQELADVAVGELADVVSVVVLDSVLQGEAPRPGPLVDPVTVRQAGFRVVEAITAVPTMLEVGEVRVIPRGTPFAQALSDLRPRLVPALGPDDPWLVRHPAYAEVAREMGSHSLMAVPLAARGVVLGMASFYRGPGSLPFDDGDLGVATDVVARAAVCVDNARRYTRERTIARLTQRALVPDRLPSQSAAETTFTFLPVASSGVWYDVIPLSGARIALVAGDVSGHGLHTVTTMGRLRTAISALAAMDLQADELLEHLHALTEQLAREHPPVENSDQSELTATCLFVIYDPVTRTCTLSRAGHPAPVLALPDGSIHVIDVPAGPNLGRGVASYRSTSVDLPEGSILTLHNAELLQDTDQDQLPAFQNAFSTPTGLTGRLQDMCDALMNSLLPDNPVDDALLLLARTRSLGPDQVASWTLPHEPESAAAARRLVAGQLIDWNLDDLTFSTELIASELVTNAVRYSTGPTELRLINDRALICEVSDNSNVAPQLRHAEDDDEGGRGLYLVAQLAQHWGARHTKRGKTIWTEQTLP